MREPIEKISCLQTQLNDLQLENQILKNILDNAGISYRQELMHLRSSDEVREYDPNQGARIQAPAEITEKMAVMFYSRFWGRQDVYAKRNEKKDTGEASYFTQCHNFWKEVCPKKHRQKINCKDCKYQSYKQLTKDDILMHLRSRSYNASDVIGVYPLLTDGTCRVWVYDFDNHEKGAEKKDFANEDAMVYQFICEDNNYFYAIVEMAMLTALKYSKGEESDMEKINLPHIISNRHVLFMDTKASSSSEIKPPMADELLEYYTPEQLRMHFMSLGLSSKSVGFKPQVYMPQEERTGIDMVLKIVYHMFLMIISER